MPRPCACRVRSSSWHSSITSASDTGSGDKDSLPDSINARIEDFVDQVQQVPAGLENLVDAALLEGVGCGRRNRSVGQSRESRRGGVAQLVAHAGKEFRFREVGLFSRRTWLAQFHFDLLAR